MSLYGSSSVTPRLYPVLQSTRLGAQAVQESASDQTHQRTDSSFGLHLLSGVGIKEEPTVLTQFLQLNEGYKASFISACEGVQSTCSEFFKWVAVPTKRESRAEQYLVDISNKYKQV